MALRWIMLLIFQLLVSGIRSDPKFVPPKSEIEKLSAKVAYIESKYYEQKKEIKEIDERLSTQLASLEREIVLFKVDKLIELETQAGKIEALEAKVTKAETTVQQLGRRLEYATEIAERLRLEMKSLECNIEITDQIELGKVQSRVNLEAVLKEVHGAWSAWIPHWLTSSIFGFQEMLFRNLNKIVRGHKDDQGQLSTIRPRVIKAAYSKTGIVYGICMNAITPRFIKARQTVRPYLQAAYSKTTDLYGICMNAIKLRFIKVGQTVWLYLQRVKQLFGPYNCFAIARADTDAVAAVHKPCKKEDVHSN